MYSTSNNKFTVQPTPLSVAFAAPTLPGGAAEIIIDPASPYYPHSFAADNGVDGQPLGVLYRCFLCGNRANEDTNNAWQIVAGIKGTAWNWNWDGSFNYSANTSKEQPRNGFFQYSQIVPLLNTLVNTSFNPFGPSLDSAQQAVNALQFTGVTENSKLDGYGIDLKGSGDIYDLPAGPLAAAVGFQAGKQTLSQSFNPLMLSRRYNGLRRELCGRRPVAHAMGGVRRNQRSDHQRARTRRPAAVRPLQRFREHHEPESEPALATRQDGGAAWLLGHGLRGADALPVVDPRDAGHIGARSIGSAALSGPERAGQRKQPRLQHAVPDNSRRQPRTSIPPSPRHGRSAGSSRRCRAFRSAPTGSGWISRIRSSPACRSARSWIRSCIRFTAIW